MKKILLLMPLALLLFVGSVVGLLAAQGRLNHAGTRGIPILQSFFAAPPQDQAPAGADDRPTDAHPAPAGERVGVQAEGLGKEEPLPYRVGSSLFEAAGEGEGEGGGHGAAAAEGGDHGGEGGQEAHPPAAQGGEHAEPAAEVGHGVTPPPAGDGAQQPLEGTPEWRTRAEALLGQGQYRPGRYFAFPQLEAGIGVDEINEILESARKERAEAERERAALARQRAEVEARERDVADRQESVMQQMREVEQLRARVQAEIDEFHATVRLIRQDEMAGLQAVGKTLAAIEPASAAAVIKRWWETNEGQARALKIWSVMSPDAANAILGELDVELIRQVLEQRLEVVKEQKAAGKR